MNNTRAVDVSIQAVSPALICIKAPHTIVAAALPNPRGRKRFATFNPIWAIVISRCER
jgi:hypothetical protein